MNNAHLHQLIDDYLLGTISPEQKTHLENEMASDPAVAQLVRESQLAFDAIRVARDQQRRAMLKKLDATSSGADSQKKKGLLFRMMGGLGILMFIIWVIWHFTPSQLAKRFLEHDPQMRNLLSSEQRSALDQAFLFFDKKEYENAASVFRALAENENALVSSSSKWNSMMCTLALHGVTPDMEKDMAWVSDFGEESYRKKADRLRRTIDFPGYRWFYTRIFRHGASLIRPGII